MNYLVFVASLLVMSISSTIAVPGDPPSIQDLSSLCKELNKSIDSGSFVARKKILDDCAAKSFSPTQSKALDKCRAILPMETPSDVKKVCANIKSNETKYQQLRSCFKTNSPGLPAKKSFKDCLMTALGKE